MGKDLNYSGLVIAGIGFFLTRFTVTLAISQDPVRFYLAGVAPLVLGLGLAAFGMALVVAEVDATMVRTTARWCVLGTVTMFVLIVLTLFGTTTGTVGSLSTFTMTLSRTYLSNFLIGGSIGGTLTGLYAARNARQRAELTQQAHRLSVLNRLLRHEVLNAVAVIRGYASVGDELGPEATEVIDEYADDIEQTIDEVKHLTWNARTGDSASESVVVGDCLTESVQAVRDRYPDASITVDGPQDELAVTADGRLSQVFEPLLENAVVHTVAGEPTVDVSVTSTERWVRVAVRDDGPGLPENQRSLLEHGDIDTYDNPRTGFGLNIVRLLVENYRGRIETSVDSSGTTIEVSLPRATTDDSAVMPAQSGTAGIRPALPQMSVTFVAALVAGGIYGLTAELLGGSISFIGVYYGVNDTVVGWLTHEFHSVVFAFVFVGILSAAPHRYRGSLPANVSIGAAWGVFLWFFAAGVISPVWLRLLSISVPLPNLSPMILVTHLIWGVSLGVLSALGNQYATPWVAAVGSRVSGRFDLA